LYVQRALLGFAGLMDDLNPACVFKIAQKYGVQNSGRSGCVPLDCSSHSKRLRTP
jgi:hypothetical protein